MPLELDPELLAATGNSKAWPFEEARRLITRLGRLKDDADKTCLLYTSEGADDTQLVQMEVRGGS